MLNKFRKPLSLVLVLVMVWTVGITAKPVQAADEAEYLTYVEIATPYEKIAGYYVDLTKDDLTDDFGIGLPKDGSDGYSGARAFAKALRRYVFEKTYLKKGEDFYDFSEADVKKANEQMPNFLKSSMTEYGLYIEGIAADGKTMNAGTAKDGKVDADGAWTILKDEKYSEVGLSSMTLSKDDTTCVEVYWASGASDYVNGWPSVGRFEGAYYILADGRMYDGYGKESDHVKLVKDSYVFDAASGKMVAKTTPVSGASVTIFSEDDSEASTKPVAVVTTDENGMLGKDKTGLNDGYYRLEATEEAQSADGSYTYSKMTYTAGFIVLIDKPGMPKQVKSKVSGKTPKQKIRLSWKNPANYKDFSDIYQVYISKKKNTGYKKAGKDVYTNKFTMKQKKGIYYVKVRTVRCRDIGGEDQLKTIRLNGEFSEPVKIRVK